MFIDYGIKVIWKSMTLKQRLSLEVRLGVLLRVEGSIGGKRKRRGRGLGSADPDAQRFARSSQGHLLAWVPYTHQGACLPF